MCFLDAQHLLVLVQDKGPNSHLHALAAALSAPLWAGCQPTEVARGVATSQSELWMRMIKLTIQDLMACHLFPSWHIASLQILVVTRAWVQLGKSHKLPKVQRLGSVAGKQDLV